MEQGRNYKRYLFNKTRLDRGKYFTVSQPGMGGGLGPHIHIKKQYWLFAAHKRCVFWTV